MFDLISNFWTSYDETVVDWFEAAGILLGYILVVLLLCVLWARLLRPLLNGLLDSISPRIPLALRNSVIWIVLWDGFYEAATSLDKVSGSHRLEKLFDNGYHVGMVLLALLAGVRFLDLIASVYAARLSASDSEEGNEAKSRIHVLQKTATVLVFIIALFYFLQAIGVNTNPLLASGAVGGLVIGLALQDTLSNLFAGFFLNIDRPVKAGDLIQLEGGQEGYLQEIGWRYTKLRLRTNKVMVIPNAKMGQTILINCNLPRPDTSIYVSCGVAYDSDLEKVERVTNEVAREIQQRVLGADSAWEPYVEWMEFGDSAIIFRTVLRITDVRIQVQLQSEFIKALHKRFSKEGIEIPFPIRKIIMQKA